MDVNQTIKGLFDTAIDAICAHRDGLIIVANPAFARLFGHDSADDMAGRPVIETLAPEERARIGETIRRRTSGEEVASVYTTKGLRRDGSRFDLEIGASTFMMDGERFCVAVLRDISEAVAAKVLAWRHSNTMEADFCVEAPEEALTRFVSPELKTAAIRYRRSRERGPAITAGLLHSQQFESHSRHQGNPKSDSAHTGQTLDCIKPAFTQINIDTHQKSSQYLCRLS